MAYRKRKKKSALRGWLENQGKRDRATSTRQDMLYSQRAAYYWSKMTPRQQEMARDISFRKMRKLLG